MIEEIEYRMRCYSDIVENMLILAGHIQDASELTGLLSVVHTDMNQLLSHVEESIKKEKSKNSF